MTTQNLNLKAEKIRLRLLEIIYNGKAGHTGGDLSAVNVLTSLYFDILNIDPKNPKMESRDRFILSKGHCAEVLYSVLEAAGFLSSEIVDTYGQDYSPLAGHPTVKNKGVEINTGALGHGLSAGIGMALAAKMNSKTYKTFVLMGDGEQAEGSIYEAAMAGHKYKLDNLIAIIDRNGLQISGKTEDVMPLESIKDKWTAFGWDVLEMNGDNIEDIVKTIKNIDYNNNKPHLIISKTTKGKGVSYMENVAKWHHGVPNQEEYVKAVNEIKQRIAALQ